MTVDPRIQAILDAAASAPPRGPAASIAEARAFADEMMGQTFMALAEPGPEPAKVTDQTVPVAGGQIMVRVYRPFGDGPFPGHVYFHGGGFWVGNLDSFDPSCRALSAGTGAVVVSVDYRLAPEYKYPTAAEDCYAALGWTVDHAADLEIDSSRLSIGGGSAGGNLAAVVALMARDRGGPPVIFQLLEIPVTDLTMSQPSVTTNGEGYLLTRAAMAQYRDYYLADPAQANEPYASPLLAPDLSGLPPALVMTMEYDPLRDEGEAYARRLAEAGVPTTQKRWEGHIHGSTVFTKLVPSARQCQDEVIAALRQAYGLLPLAPSER